MKLTTLLATASLLLLSFSLQSMQPKVLLPNYAQKVIIKIDKGKKISKIDAIYKNNATTSATALHTTITMMKNLTATREYIWFNYHEDLWDDGWQKIEPLPEDHSSYYVAVIQTLINNGKNLCVPNPLNETLFYAIAKKTDWTLLRSYSATH